VQLYTKIFIGLVAGIVVGGFANVLELAWLQGLLQRIEPLGTIFIRLIMMIVIPLIVASLILGTASLGDIRKLGRLGGKTVAFYMFTTAAAVTMGLLVSNIVRPGAHIDPVTRDEIAAVFEEDAAGRLDIVPERPSLGETVMNMVPSNPFRSAAEGELLPLIIFSVIFGAALSLVVRERREAVLLFFNGINDAVMVIIDWIMRLAPYAVFALVGAIVSRFGLDLLQSLLVYTLVVAGGLTLHLLITYMSILRFLGGMSPLVFARRMAEAPLVAFSTSSSSATLPVTMEVAREKLGVSHETSSFVLPLGATINMDGTALYQAVAVMFIAQIYGIPLGIMEQLTIVLTATLASIGAAGVPSAGIITLIMVLHSVGLGAHTQTGIALILGVDRILDMLRTAVNVTGDLTASVVIARSEGEELVPRPVHHPIAIGKRD
jgi:proton glutamate symport protein